MAFAYIGSSMNKSLISIILSVVMVMGSVVPGFAKVKTTETMETFSDIQGDAFVDFPEDFDVDVSTLDTTAGYIPTAEDYNVEPVRYLNRSYESEEGFYTARKYVPKLEELPTPRNQGDFGSCWAHGSIALAEFNMLKNGYETTSDIDYSELALVYFTYNEHSDPLGGLEGDNNVYIDKSRDVIDRGGNANFASKMLACWLGAVSENKAPYSLAGKISSLDGDIAYQDETHLKSYAQFNMRENRELAKDWIYHQGAVATSYRSDSKYYMKENNSYYNPNTVATNHAISIVGWDDDFPAENFNVTPPGDGAWLVRNSWFLDTDPLYSCFGYFWMSYYDETIATLAVGAEYEPADAHDNNYQYDGTVSSGYTYNTGGQLKVANVFETMAAKEEILDAVAFHTTMPEQKYKVSIYLLDNDYKSPDDGELAEDTVTEGYVLTSGLHNVELNNPLILKKGQKFAVVVELWALGGEARISKDIQSGTKDSWYRCDVASSAGQSYVFSNGKWTDAGANNKGNFRIKAYTKNVTAGSVKPTSISINPVSAVTIGKGANEPLRTVIMPSNAVDKRVLWSTSDESIVTVNAGGIISGVSKGTATITAKCVADEALQDCIEVTVTDAPQRIELSGPEKLKVGEASKVSCIVYPKMDAGAIKWSSGDNHVISVDDEGNIAALTMGDAAIEADVNGVKKKIIIEVFPADVTLNINMLEDGSAYLFWDNDECADRYELTRKIDGVADLNIYSVSGNKAGERFFCDDGLNEFPNGTSVEYEVMLHANYESSDRVSVGRITFDKSPKYSVTYNMMGFGENPKENRDYYYPTVAPWEIYSPHPVPGMKFNGWYYLYEDAETGENVKEYIESLIDIRDDGDVQLFADWTEVEHIYENSTIIKDSTYYEEGIRSFTCINCKQTVTEPIAKIPFDETVDKSSIKDGVLYVNLVKGGKSEPIAELAKQKSDKQYFVEYSDKSIATIDKKGRVKGKKQGEATAMVKTEAGEYTVHIRVDIPSFKVDSLVLLKGDVVSACQVQGCTLMPEYFSKKPDIADIDSSDALLRARRYGKTTVCARVNGKLYKLKVQVVDPVLLFGKTDFLAGESTKFKISQGYGKTKWESSDKKVAIVDEKGKVHALSKGRAVITAENFGVTRSVEIVVR